MAVKKVEKKDSKANEQNQSQSIEPNVFDTSVESTTEEGTDEAETEKEDTFKAHQESIEPMFTKSDVEEMMKRVQEEFSEKLKKSFIEYDRRSSARREVGEKEDFSKDIVDDWLPEQVVFFSYVSEYFLGGDIRMGKEVLPPLGKLKFHNMVRAKRRNEKGTHVICISVYKSQSKREVEYLRNHSLFNITFHEKISTALSVDAMYAQNLIDANQEVQSMSDHQVITRAKAEEINAGTDVSLMRKELIQRIAQRKKAQMDAYYRDVEKKLSNMQTYGDGANEGLRQVTIK